MLTKTCSKCGWVLSADNKARLCPICKSLINQGLCSTCGNYAEVLREGFYCDDCYRERVKATYKRKYHKYVTKHADSLDCWLQKVSSVPKSYPTLTEAQWLEVCKYFNGCAFCGSDEIDTRVYFIAFEKGGRYCDWNILPSCEKCALSAKGTSNPFKGMAGRNIYTVPILNKVLSYLEAKLDAATGKVK